MGTEIGSVSQNYFAFTPVNNNVLKSEMTFLISEACRE